MNKCWKLLLFNIFSVFDFSSPFKLLHKPSLRCLHPPAPPDIMSVTMDAFLSTIQTCNDRNFLLAVKYSNIMDLVQQRLEYLNSQKNITAAQNKAKSSGAVPTLNVTDSTAKESAGVSPQATTQTTQKDSQHAPDNDAHGGAAVDAANTVDSLKEVVDTNDTKDKFTIVKIGADWCKPCVKVS